MISSVSLSEQVEHTLRRDIVTCVLKPGERIDIRALASKWNISTTPIRDALRRLDALGLVNVAPRRGFFVAVPDRQLLNDIFELRTALECVAICSAGPAIPDKEVAKAMHQTEEARRVFRETGDRKLLIRHDTASHELILKHCKNRKLVQIMNELGDLIAWTRGLITVDPHTYEEAASEHSAVLAALQQKDVDKAQQAMRRHLETSRRRVHDGWDLHESIPAQPEGGEEGH